MLSQIVWKILITLIANSCFFFFVCFFSPQRALLDVPVLLAAATRPFLLLHASLPILLYIYIQSAPPPLFFLLPAQSLIFFHIFIRKKAEKKITVFFQYIMCIYISILLGAWARPATKPVQLSHLEAKKETSRVLLFVCFFSFKWCYVVRSTHTWNSSRGFMAIWVLVICVCLLFFFWLWCRWFLCSKRKGKLKRISFASTTQKKKKIDL